MVSPTGPTRRALFLVCCTGAWLAVHMAPTRSPYCQIIVRELKGLSEKLLEVQKDEVGLPTTRYPLLPSLTHHCQPGHINGPAILPYCKAIQPRVQNATNATVIKVIQQLEKIETLQCVPDTEVMAPTVPSKDFQSKWFISTVLRELSLCFKLL